MPDNLKMLNPYYSFNLYPMPDNVFDFISQNYKRVCKVCETDVKNKLICLLCGEVLCLDCIVCKELPGLQEINDSREFILHAKKVEGGSSIFISSITGDIILTDGDDVEILPVPYLTKLGE